MISTDLKVIATAPESVEHAQQLSARLGWPVSQDLTADGLLVNPDRLTLRWAGERLSFDFASAPQSYRRRFGGGYGQAIARACLVKPASAPTILDATAGTGQDAFVLASLGAQVTLLERSLVVATLLEDALRRARQEPEIVMIASRMQLRQIEALDYLNALIGADYPEVIYLDPMYPAAVKSARKTKAMRLFRSLVGDDSDADALLGLAQQRCTKRVVVKRPGKAPWLGMRQPSGAISMKNTRFDIYPSQVAA